MREIRTSGVMRAEAPEQAVARLALRYSTAFFLGCELLQAIDLQREIA